MSPLFLERSYIFLFQPRPNEAGGKFGNGIITRKYKKNEIISIGVDLTANHMGYFEFRICPNNNVKKVASPRCFERYLLEQANGQGPKYYPGPGNKKIYMKYQLPKGLTCTQCVLQWRYVAGNNWGKCKNGTGAVGCGAQEQFRGCSDVLISGEPWEEPTQFYDDYDDEESNSIADSSDGHVQNEGKVHHPEDYHGYIAALIAGCLLPVFICLGVFFYFYYAKKTIKQILRKKQVIPVPEKVSVLAPKSLKPDEPAMVYPPPMRPPRSNKQPKQTEIRPKSDAMYDHSITTVNGVAV